MIRGRHRGTHDGGRARLLATCLSRASVYWRAAGFFSSSVFTVAPEAFRSFIQRGGQIRVVCSPCLSASDIAALHRAYYSYRSPSEVLPLAPDTQDRATRFLEWCVAQRSVALRIATLNPERPGALYHEKFGVTLGTRAQAAFFGSANETRNGYLQNFELVQAFDPDRSEPDWEQVRSLERAFVDLWENRTPGLRVVDLHEAFRAGLLREAAEAETVNPNDGEQSRSLHVPRETLRSPDGLVLRSYQREAVRAWLGNGGKGILAMATGAGKTITALSAAERVLQAQGAPLIIVIVAPYLHLVDQWVREARKFGLLPIQCSGSNPRWREEAASAVFSVNAGQMPVLSMVTTNATFASAAFASVIQLIRSRTILIVDEVHNLGAAQLARALPTPVSLRLGLSATPERHYDATGSRALEEYFGGVVFRFGLRDAITSDPPVLTPYRYFPILVELEEDEAEEYHRLTDAIARQLRNADDDDLGSVALGLLVKRARLVASARQKLPLLRTAIAPYARESQIIVYCGDGRMEVDAISGNNADAEEPEFVKQIEATVNLLGVQLGMNVGTYTAATAPDDRERLRIDFASGRKQALIAIRCLDEGVDFPEARRAFILASSSNPRQFIQRRGRLLRRAPGKDSAEIFDFVVVPPVSLFEAGSPEYAVMQRLVRKEMERLVEFASIATNGPQARAVIRPVLEKLKLLELV